MEQALVIDLDDIAAGLADQAGDRPEHAGLVLDVDAQADQPSIAHKAAHQDGRKHARIDVAAGDDDADSAAGEAVPVLEDGGQRGRAGALDHRLFDFEQHQNGAFQRRLIDQQNFGDVPANDFASDLSGPLDGDAFGNRGAAGPDFLAGQTLFHRRIERRLRAEQFDAGLHFGRDQRHAANQAAAADRHDKRVKVRRVLQHLERRRSLPCNDLRVVVGMDDGQTFARRDLQRVVVALGEIGAMQDDPGAEMFGLPHFVERSLRRHHDGRRNAQTPRMVGDALGMVAGRGGDNAGLARGIVERREFHIGAAVLERRRVLQVLEFQPDPAPGNLRQGARVQRRRAYDLAVQEPGCLADVVRGNGHCLFSVASGRGLSSSTPAAFCRAVASSGARRQWRTSRHSCTRLS